MMRCGTGLDPDQVRRQLLEERQEVAALQLTADQHVAFRVDAVHLKYRLAMSRPTVVTVCMIGSSESWGLNSPHIHGTHVPVGEPSTASEADLVPY